MPILLSNRGSLGSVVLLHYRECDSKQFCGDLSKKFFKEKKN